MTDLIWKTDLAVEAKRLWDTSSGRKSKLLGVKARTYSCCGIPAESVEILNDEGASSLGKAVGNYVTLDIASIYKKEREIFENTVSAISKTLQAMLPDCKRFLVAGLGNCDITPDLLGPKVLDYLIITRHLCAAGAAPFAEFASVCAVAPGVLGKTGIESAQIVKGICDFANVDAVIVVDALASCEPDRLCATLQISDTGMVPGSGVGNHRAAFTKETIGVPVIAMGVPTVVDGGTFLSGGGVEPLPFHSNLILSHRDIDQRINDMARLIGYGINLALHPFLTVDDIPSLVI